MRKLVVALAASGLVSGCASNLAGYLISLQKLQAQGASAATVASSIVSGPSAPSSTHNGISCGIGPTPSPTATPIQLSRSVSSQHWAEEIAQRKVGGTVIPSRTEYNTLQALANKYNQPINYTDSKPSDMGFIFFFQGPFTDTQIGLPILVTGDDSTSSSPINGATGKPYQEGGAIVAEKDGVVLVAWLGP
jgi:hypothetical protein